MKIKLLLLLLLLSGRFSWAQRYDTTYASLAQRPIPGWFEDAKFGIFIHWGPYSVPAWGPKGTYAEWYQRWLQTRHVSGNGQFTGTEVADHHAKKYGAGYSYYNFGQDFKTENFDPQQWAQLFEQAGAKYIVITSKHHDGFCLWPSAEADRDWGRPWNSLSAGPQRNLLRELKEAVDKTSVKFGVYYSLYEWYNPLWRLDDKTVYVEKHMLPQMRELINQYQPWVFWTDGQWDLPVDTWQSKQFLSWLYSDSPVKDKVVTNGRWGKDNNNRLGDFLSTEYAGTAEHTKPWEECRGIGFSFGYNRNEDLEDYSSTQTLLLLFIDIVSHGGNLLLDIGPDGTGKIPPIMQERLLQIGHWLKINGEAIYGSRKWKHPVQWSAGKQVDGNTYKKEKKLAYLGADFILKQTVQPDPGYAVKEIFFTQKNGNVYAIVPQLKNKITIRDINLGKNAKLSLLGYGKKLRWQYNHPVLEIDLSDVPAHELPFAEAYVFKITDAE